MYRAAYRNFGTYESIVISHTVQGSTANAVRWYELRNLGGTPLVQQQGTYNPDNSHRWMPSIAQDSAGNIAVGYSKSSSSMFPAIAYTAWSPGDTPGVMQTETILKAGGGSQDGTLHRWGDYCQMSIDPVRRLLLFISFQCCLS